MKKTFTLALLALFLLSACDPKPGPDEPLKPQTPEELIIGEWNNTANSHMALTDESGTEVMAYDPDAFTFTFGEDGTLRMVYRSTELTTPGVENTTYQLRNDSLILGDGFVYTVSLLTDSVLVLDYSESMGDGAMLYQEHLDMVRQRP